MSPPSLYKRCTVKVTFTQLQAIERKRPKDEREFVNKHKPFARLQTATDFDVFIDGLLCKSYHPILFLPGYLSRRP